MLLEWFEQTFPSLPDEIDFEQFKKVLHIKEVNTNSIQQYHRICRIVNIKYHMISML